MRERMTDDELANIEHWDDVYAKSGVPSDAMLRSLIAELRELRALLATPMPCGWDGPAVVARSDGFASLMNDDGVYWPQMLPGAVDPDDAIAFGAAWLRAALAAKERK